MLHAPADESGALLRARAVQRRGGGHGAARSRHAISPYVQTAWRYARGVALAQKGDTKGAARELAEIERIVATTDYKPFDAWKIPAKDVGQIAAHVLRARIAQAGNDLDGAVRELQAAIKIQDTLPYMEPAYWYYPVRQSLGALLLLKGDTKARARSLRRKPRAHAEQRMGALRARGRPMRAKA